jgi:hypothetical protein
VLAKRLPEGWPWRRGLGELVEPADAVGYFCPCCGLQAPVDAWLTQAQVALAQNVVAREFIGPVVSKLGAYELPDKIDPLTEAGDIPLIVFPCHPSEPLKVLDDWRKPMYCLIYGKSPA